MSSFTPTETRAISMLATLYVVRMLGLFMVLPLIAVYSADMTGATPFLLGLAVGAYGLTQSTLQIPMGWLSDRIDRRWVIVFGLSLLTLNHDQCIGGICTKDVSQTCATNLELR